MRILKLIIVVLIFPAALYAARPGIAVMDLEDKSGYHGADIGSGMADMLVTGLVETKKFKVIEREALKKVLAEQSLGMSGAVTPQTAARVGKILGVQYIVTGSVTEYGRQKGGAGAFGVGVKKQTARTAMDIRVIDTETAEIVAAVSGKGEKTSSSLKIANADILPTDVKLGSDSYNSTLEGKAVREAVEQVTKQLVRQFGGTPSSTVVKVSEDTIYISGGADSGIEEGDSFTIIRKGESLIDPETGEDLGSEDKIVGEIKIFEVLEKMSKARITKGSGIVRGDKAKKN
ncbi:MAG: CsgG/HfaB family protein [Elusimicrobiota bacterium]